MKSVHTKLKRFVSLLVILGIFLGTVPVHANQTIEFEPVDLPIVEMNWPRIYVHPQNDQFVFLLDQGNGIYITKDGAEKWSKYHIPGFNTDSVVSMAISESNPSVWYVATTTELLTTKDSGGTWVKVKEIEGNKTFGNVFIHPKNHSFVLLVANGDTVYFTYDSWQSFNHKSFIDLRIAYSYVGLDFLDQQTFYVPHNHTGGYSYTNDGGKTWSTKSNPWHPEPHRISAFITPDPSNSNVLYIRDNTNGSLWKSTNKGGSWVRILEESGTHYAFGYPVFDRQSPQPGLHGSQGAFYTYLAPGSETYQKESIPGTVREYISSLAVSHQNHQKIYIAGLQGVFKSEDLGQTWSIKNNGLSGFRATSLQKNNLGEFIIVTGNDNVFKASGDWDTVQNLALPFNNNNWMRRIIYLDPRYPNRQYYYPTVANNPADHFLYYSDDDWETSHTITVLSTGLYYPHGMVFDAEEDGPTYLGMRKRERHVAKEYLGIYMSGAPGEDWTWLDLNSGYPYRPYIMRADPNQGNTLYVVTFDQEGKQLATLRVNTQTGNYVKIGGEGSVFQTKKVAHMTLDPLKPGRIYIGVFPTLDWDDSTLTAQITNYRSDDYGESWTPIRLPGYMLISPQNSDLLIGVQQLRDNGVIYNNDYFKSIDGGKSYQTFHAAYPVFPEETFVRLSNHVFDPNDDNVLYFGTTGKGIWKMTFHGQASIYTNSYFPVITTKE